MLVLFGAIIALTQLSIENGEPLFYVEYNDVYLGVGT